LSFNSNTSSFGFYLNGLTSALHLNWVRINHIFSRNYIFRSVASIPLFSFLLNLLI
jgi:hypothetical protein